MRWASRSSSADPLRGARALRLLVALLAAAACDGREPRAVILEEPADTAAFEGMAALFQVKASGTGGVRYQWNREGVPIPGANDSHLLVPDAGPGDDGARYSVTVTNTGADPVESRRALLTVYPPLDLRFKWVGAPFTTGTVANGDLLADYSFGERSTYFAATGSPLLMGTVCSAGASCSWVYVVFSAPDGMSIAYEAGPIANLDALGASWAAGLPPGAVVASLDLHEAAGVYALSFAESSQAGEFTPVVQGSAAPEDMPSVASSEGDQGRVLTAVSYRGGLVSWVSYGWSRAGSIAYDARVVVTGFGSAAAEAASLASEGYALTACGAGDDGANGVVLVGTRVRGVTTPVPILVVTSPETPWDHFPGYALVGLLAEPAGGPYVFLLER